MRKFADLSLLGVSFIWGATFVIVQNAVNILDPFSFIAVRFGIAALFLFAWCFIFHKQLLSRWNKKLIMSGSILGVLLFLAYVLQTFGLLYTSSSKSGFITGLSVLLVPIFSFIILKQLPQANAIIGVITATVGLYLLTIGGSLNVNFGDFLTFFCAISFATHIIFTGKYTTLHSTLLLTITQIAVVSILSFISAILFEDWMLMFDREVIGHFDVIMALVITSLFATALAFIAQTNFQKFSTPTRVALIFAMEPVFAAATAFLLANERLGIQATIGCFLIFIGMIFAELPQKRFLHEKKTRQQANG